MGNSTSHLFADEWRKMEWENRDQMIQDAKEFHPENKRIKHVRILLHGPVGSGKSSFVNSASSSIRGKMTHDAHVDNMGGESFTLKTQTHKIQKGKAEDFCSFVFSDLMGLEKNDGIHEEDIKMALKGHIKDGYTFNPLAVISDKDPHYKLHPDPEDKIHVLVCVIPAPHVPILPQEILDKIRRIRLAASGLGIPQICLLTKIDETSDDLKKDIKNVYKLKIVKKQMEEFSAKVGIPMTCIFPVKNYHEEVDLDNDTDVMILKALQQMISLGEDFINKMLGSC